MFERVLHIINWKIARVRTANWQILPPREYILLLSVILGVIKVNRLTIKTLLIILTLFCYTSTGLAGVLNIFTNHNNTINHNKSLLLDLNNHYLNLTYELKKFIIMVNSKTQILDVYDPNKILLKSYLISTSKKGLGQLMGSFKTPVGLHQITKKIGDGIPHNGIFRYRKFTNVVWKKNKNIPHKKDFIVTRIIRLTGLEPGINSGKNHRGQVVDSFMRGIYIHGTTMDWKLGTPSTIGCVHLSSQDIVELFNLVPIGTLVVIY